MSDTDDNDAPGPVSSLLGSLAKVFATVIGIAQTRLEILSTELQQEVTQAAQMLLWAFVAVFAAGTGLFIGGLVLIFAFWETHRLLAAALVMVFFFLLAVIAVFMLRAKVKSRGRLFEATLAEFAKDREHLGPRR
ncbi:MAG: phage holin family protein [Steroidobacteraceae bacterium]